MEQEGSSEKIEIYTTLLLHERQKKKSQYKNNIHELNHIQTHLKQNFFLDTTPPPPFISRSGCGTAYGLTVVKENDGVNESTMGVLE